VSPSRCQLATASYPAAGAKSPLCHISRLPMLSIDGWHRALVGGLHRILTSLMCYFLPFKTAMRTSSHRIGLVISVGTRRMHLSVPMVADGDWRCAPIVDSLRMILASLAHYCAFPSGWRRGQARTVSSSSSLPRGMTGRGCNGRSRSCASGRMETHIKWTSP
jgi:hypothetical protein